MKQHSRIVYAGTPEFAVPALRVLLDSGVKVVAVYTQPDRPAGRGRKLAASPVKQLALERDLPVEQPELFTPPAVETLASFKADLMVVAAYGLILPRPVLALPRIGCINIHASLLPRWRGAAPIQRAILAGDAETGVSLMSMEAGLDTGPVYAKKTIPIAQGQTAADMHDCLARLGAELLRDCLPQLLEGKLAATPQDPSAVTYAAKLQKSEAWLDWAQPAGLLQRQILAFNSWPVAQTQLHDQVIRIWRASVADESASSAQPGAILAVDAAGILVATGGGILRVLELQRPGGKILPAADFINAVDLHGARFG
ncbi:MAG TPA: methionyl-tRNA formyltransferase [Gammaproteobacteria bacterium]|nr:methionyl-tRNA formyltransferase [Gammaproteobacteria bacterium]